MPTPLRNQLMLGPKLEFVEGWTSLSWGNRKWW